jgi:hypothetical protein
MLCDTDNRRRDRADSHMYVGRYPLLLKLGLNLLEVTPRILVFLVDDPWLYRWNRFG